MKRVYQTLLCTFLLFNAGITAVWSQESETDFVKRRLEKYFTYAEYVDVEGSPFLFDAWSTGIVKFANGKQASNLKLKYDLVKDQLIFENPDVPGQLLLFEDKVSEFKLDGTNQSFYFRNGFQNAGINTKETFYQILFEGNSSLLKKGSKTVFENRPFNIATVTRSVKEQTAYYIAKGNTPVKIKRDKKTILSILGNHTAELEQFIQVNTLDLKNDADLVKLMNYYNSIRI